MKMRETTQLKRAQIEAGQRKMKDYLQVAGRGLEQGPAKILRGQPGSHDVGLTFLPIGEADVARVYSGRPGCMCGCQGGYWSPTKEDLPDWDKGGKVSPKQVRAVLKKMRDNASKGIEMIAGSTTLSAYNKADDTEDIYSLELNGRSYVIYTKKPLAKAELVAKAAELNKARAGAGVKR